MMNIEKLTTSLQFIGAALALPAGAAGVYSAYHSYFSPEVVCQEMRNATLITLEKNIPAEAKRTLLRKEASQFEAKCGEIEPEANTIFQVALQELDKPAPARAAPRAPRPASPEKTPSTPRTEAAMAAIAPADAPAAAVSGPVAAVAPAAAPAGGQGLGRAVHGWVAIEIRKGGKVTEAYFSGYAATGQSPPGAGTGADRNGGAADLVRAAGPAGTIRTSCRGGSRPAECVRIVLAPGPPRRAAMGRSRAHAVPMMVPLDMPLMCP